MSTRWNPQNSTHTHTHTDKPCQVKKQIGTICLILISFFISPTFATEITDPATCDSGTLSTDTGPTNLRANYESNVLNLKWYDDDYNRINVSSTSSDSCTYGGSINLPTPPTKKGYTFKGWKVLPYNQIEYIEATGIQWIDTGIQTNTLYGMSVDMRAMITDWTNERALVGVKEECLGFELYTTTNQTLGPFMGLYNTSNSVARAYGLNPNMIHDIRVGLTNSAVLLNVDGTDYNTNTPTWSGSNGGNFTFTLLKLCSGYYAKAKIYYVKLYNNGTLVRDMIPVKDSNGVACMYDKVSGNFFYNAGTGNFIAGPDL